MFLIRQAKPKDVGTLGKLARMVHFVNLPANDQLILDKINHSSRCFSKAAGMQVEVAEPRRKQAGRGGYSALDADTDAFMFTLEDLDSGGVIGTSQIRARQGGPGNPNWSMRLSEKKFSSPALGQGTTHTVMQLYGDETGPTEVGGLILAPSHRGHRTRPGRFLSFVRFHFIALNRPFFADRIIAEMMPHVTHDGDNAFWDAFGRKFIPVRYAEADRFCQFDRRFISDLLPKEEIYLSLLPMEIQNLVGSVARDTEPAKRMLESIGFAYRNFVDPFDGGPHIEAETDKVTLVKDTVRAEIGKAVSHDRCDAQAIVSIVTDDGEFRAMDTACAVQDGIVRLPEAAMKSLGATSGMACGMTPLPVRPPVHAEPVPERKPERKTAKSQRAKAVSRSSAAAGARTATKKARA